MEDHVEDLEQEDESDDSEEGEGDEEEEMDQVPTPAHYLCQYLRDLARACQGLPPEAPTVANNQVSSFDFIET